MINLALRMVLTAFVFTFIFPMIGGVQFHGGFWPEGIACGLLLAAIGYAFSILAKAITLATFGLFGLVLLLFFWLIPAIELQVIAHYFPQTLAFDGWGSAILAGFVLMVIGTVVGAFTSK